MATFIHGKKGRQQLKLFTRKLDTAHLVAIDSPRQTFYTIWIEEADGQVQVVKESGVGGRVLDRRCWACEDLEAAKKLFDRQVKYKTNPNRKSPRKYRLLEC
jgi:hypothetical protein